MRGLKKSLYISALAFALLTSMPLSAQHNGNDASVAVTTDAAVVLTDGEGEVSSAAVEMQEAEAAEHNPRLTKEEKAQAAKENDSWGGGITIISMCVVIGALALLSILFLIFGKISTSFMSRKKMKTTGVTKATAEKHHKELDSGETIAAIALALSEHFYNRKHDLEDTILTIKRMRRNYSPWNSKIYNLRQVPELRRNVRR